MRKSAGPIHNLLSKLRPAVANRIPSEVGEGWLPYLLQGTGSAGASAFRGARGLVNAKRGILPALGVGGAAVTADALADGEIDHAGMSAILALMAGASPGARNAVSLMRRRARGNFDLVRRLSNAGVQPAQSSTDAMTDVARRLTGRSGEAPLLATLKNLFRTNDELRIGLLTNSTQSAGVSRKAMAEAPKRWGIKTMDAGDVQNPDIFHGLMEDGMLLRRQLARMGYQNLRGKASYGSTREANGMLMDALLTHAVNRSRNARFRAGRTSGVMPDYHDAGAWFARKGAVSDRRGRLLSAEDYDDLSERKAEELRKAVMNMFGVRSEADWNHATDRALAAAGSYTKLDPSKFSWHASRLPKPKAPGAELPTKPTLARWFDTQSAPTNFNVDLQKWYAARNSPAGVS